MQSSPPNDEFARTLARVHYGSRKALVELADLLPRVKLIIAVDKLPSTGERVRATLLQEADGRTLFPVFSSQTTLRRWGLANDWGTLPAVALFEVILGELASFGAHLEDKPMIMVASKIDVVNKDKLAALKKYAKKKKLKLYEISAVTGKGIEELKYAIAEEVQQLREQSLKNAEQEAS